MKLFFSLFLSSQQINLTLIISTDFFNTHAH